MNSKQLMEILNQHAPNMPLRQANEIIKAWEDNLDTKDKYEYCIITALRLLGFNDSGYPTKVIELTDEEAHVLSMMTHTQAGFACGLPGMEIALANMRKRHPIKPLIMVATKSAMESLKNQLK